MRRVIFSSLIVLAVLLTAAITFYYSQQYPVLNSDPINAIPTDAAFIIEMTNAKSAAFELQSCSFFTELSKSSNFSEVKKTFTFLDSLSKLDEKFAVLWKKQKVFISAHPTKASDFDYLFTLNLPARTGEKEIHELFSSVSKKLLASRREYEDVNIYELNDGKKSILTYAVMKGIVLISKTSFLVEDGIRQLQNGVSIKNSKPFKKANEFKSEGIALYINYLGLHDLLNSYLDQSNYELMNAISSIARWSKVNVSLSGAAIDFKGITSSMDTSNLILNFAGQKSVNSTLAGIISTRTAFFLEFNSDNPKTFYKHLAGNSTFLSDVSIRTKTLDSLSRKFGFKLEESFFNKLSNSIALVITEPGNKILDNNIYAVIGIKHKDEVIGLLTKIEKATNGTSGEYKQHVVGNLNAGNLVPMLFGKLFSKIENPYYTLLDDRLIFAGQPAMIRNMIDDYEDKKTLLFDSEFRTYPKNYFNGNLNIYLNTEKGENIIRSIGNEIVSTSFNENKWHSFSSVSMSFKNTEAAIETKGTYRFSFTGLNQINLLWSTQTDSSLVTAPALISGINGNFIAVQDAKNQLYLFDEAGRIIWKKTLSEKIKSKIFRVDYYKNGGSQLIFNTDSNLYMLDLKGDLVSSYPVRLPATATNGCSLIDFDGLNQPRIFVACSNGFVYAFELSGKPVNEWLFNRFVRDVKLPVQVIKTEKVKYIVIKDQHGGIYVADRRGHLNQIRVDLDPDAAFNSITDSSGTYLLSLNEKQQPILFKAEKNPDIHILTETHVHECAFTKTENGSKPMVIKNDSVFIYNSNGSVYNSYGMNTHTYQVLPGIDQDGIATTGLTDFKNNNFYLVKTTGSIDPRFPAKGNTSFTIFPGTFRKKKMKLVTGLKYGEILLYSVQ